MDHDGVVQKSETKNYDFLHVLHGSTCTLHILGANPRDHSHDDFEYAIYVLNRVVNNRPEVRKLLLFYFYFFSTWS